MSRNRRRDPPRLPRPRALRPLVLLLATLASCTPARLPLRRVCQDGWPIQILQDPACPRGICGYTCAPDRWRRPEK